MGRTHVMTALTLVTLAGAAIACSDGENEFSANVTSVAAIPTPMGNPVASATATMELDNDVLNIVITVTGDLTSAVTSAHLHGPATSSGTADVILDLEPSMTSVINAGAVTGTIVSAQYDLTSIPVTTTGVLRVQAPALIDLLRTGQAYVDIHTVTNPSGELRGQVAGT